MKLDLLNVKVDQVTMDQTINEVITWCAGTSKHYIVTPNIEFLMIAQKDESFRSILNQADLSVPDSARLSWLAYELNQKNILLKLLAWPLFLAPKLLPVSYFDTVTGTDLMDKLIKVSAQKGFTIGLLGGRSGLADLLKDRLIKLNPGLKVVYANSDIKVDLKGEDENADTTIEFQRLQNQIPETDILFVALGQVKQEQWIAKNLYKFPVKVMIGVGGAFDYLSGLVPRAPKIIRSLGLEWLFRLIKQPSRIKRFGALISFVFLVLKSSNKS